MISEEILVLKEVNYKENDKILHVLTKTRGKIQLMSKGCRKNNSHLINVSQLFAYSKCSLVKSKDMYIISSADLIDNFYNLKNNMDAFIYGNYILELISYISQENDIDYRIFNMTVSVLYYLSLFKNSFDKLIAAYELKLVSMLGYKPQLKFCLSCGAILKDYAVFSVEEGGFYCNNCINSTNSVISGNGINVNYNEILTMEEILKSKFENVNSININSKVIGLIRRFLFYYIGKDNFISLKLL